MSLGHNKTIGFLKIFLHEIMIFKKDLLIMNIKVLNFFYL